MSTSHSTLHPIIFLSYSSKDYEFVDMLAKDLSRSGVSVWYDQWMMKPGDKLRDKLNLGISNCKFFCIVLSTNSINSSWVKNEIDTAMIKFIEDKDIEIIPILLDIDNKTKIPPDLRGFVYCDFRNSEQSIYRKELNKLVDKITSVDLWKDPLPVPENIKGPSGKPLEEDFFSTAVNAPEQDISIESILSLWTADFCKKNRGKIINTFDSLLFKHWNDEYAEDIVGLFFYLWRSHKMKMRQLPASALRFIDNPHASETLRATLISHAGDFDIPLHEHRIVNLLSGTNNIVVYSICEYLEYHVGLIDSEHIANKLLSIVNRPDDISYFTSISKETNEETEEDIRYFAAKCLCFVDLEPSTEELIVTVLRKNFPEIEEEACGHSLNSFLVGVVYRKDSKLWKGKHDGKIKSIFDRHPIKS